MKTPSMVHEQFVTQLRVRKPDGEYEDDAVLDNLERAFATARNGAERIAAVVAAVAQDPTMTPAAAAMKAKQTAVSVGEQSAIALDQAKQAATEALAELEANIAGPVAPDDELGIALEAQMRSRLATMPDAERTKVIIGALKSGDDQTIGALLRAPGWVSGLSDTDLALRRTEWQRARHPREAAAVKRWRAAIAATERAGQNLVSFITSIASDPAVVLAEAAARHSAEALAAAAAVAKRAGA